MESAAAEKRILDYTNGGDGGRLGLVEAWLLAIAAAALGAAIQVRDGLFDPKAFVPLTIAVAAAVGVFVPWGRERMRIVEGWRVEWVFGAGIAFNFLQLFLYERPGSWHGPVADRPYRLMLLLAAGLSAGMVMDRPRRGWWFAALVAMYCVMAGRIIRQVPVPHMDVWILQTEGLKALSHGQNPFSAAFVDIYGRPEMYAVGAIGADGLVHQGFPYPPVVVWMELPGFLIGGDYRWSNIAAVAGSAVLMATARRGSSLGMLAAPLLLFTPRAFFVIESGWTEPATLFWLAAVVWCASRAPWWATGAALGIFWASKQYLVWAVPPMILLVARPTDWGKLVKMMAVAVIAGTAVSLPLILWDLQAYWHANVAIADKAAFRTDALSYLALWAHWTKHPPTAMAATIVGFGAAVMATVFVCLRGERSARGYACAVAVALMAFFAFYKFAFCNYYFLIIGALCLGAACSSVDRIEHRATENTE